MAFTYTAGSTADRDRVRLEIGDTDADRILYQDAELDDILVQEGSVMGAAARACETLAVKFARDFDFTADGSQFKKSQVAAMYEKMAKRLRARARGTTTVMPERHDAYSDDIKSDEATVGSPGLDWDRGRWEG